MDDVIVLAPTRHKLRRAVKIVNETLAELWLEKSPNKTFIGRVERGFDFLGYHLGSIQLTTYSICRRPSFYSAAEPSTPLRHR